MDLRIEENEKEVTLISEENNLGLGVEDCKEMAFGDSYPGPLIDILEGDELTPEQEEELMTACMSFYQKHRDITITEEYNFRTIWEGSLSEWEGMTDYEKAGHYIESYPDTDLTDDQIVNRLVIRHQD